MRVIHVSTYDYRGGAARSAHRLHQGLLAEGVDSQILVHKKSVQDSRILAASLQHRGAPRREHKRWKDIQRRWIDQNRTELSNTHFSAPYPGWDLEPDLAALAPDIINIHWPWWLLSPAGVARLCAVAPIVWTFHDQRAFTGGCHFSAGCHKFESDCKGCPQLRDDPLGLVPSTLADSIAALQGQPITVVTPSLWLSGCAGRSAIFQNQRVETIPYGIDTALYAPAAASPPPFDKANAEVCFLIGADNPSERRKGFGQLSAALASALRDEHFRRGAAEGRIRFLLFGDSPKQQPPELPVPLTKLGRFDSEKSLAGLYSAVDAVIIPSLDDNLPNVMLEAMSCGTPVIAHRIGGLPDVISNGDNGWLAAPDDPGSLAQALVDCAGNPAQRSAKKSRCRPTILARHTLQHQAASYQKLYAELIATNAATHGGTRGQPMPRQTSSRLLNIVRGGRCPFLNAGAAVSRILPRLCVDSPKQF